VRKKAKKSINIVESQKKHQRNILTTSHKGDERCQQIITPITLKEMLRKAKFVGGHFEKPHSRCRSLLEWCNVLK
jgi:hypothetical protein